MLPTDASYSLKQTTFCLDQKIQTINQLEEKNKDLMHQIDSMQSNHDSQI